MRRVLRAISALIFMLGSCALVFAAAGVWLYVLVMASVQTHWTAGALMFCVSFWLAHRYQDALKAPWLIWYDLWKWADARIMGTSAPPDRL